MKKAVAKLCIWMLGKLGYEKNYSHIKTYKVFIDVDANEAYKQINELYKATQKLKAELNGLHTK